MSETVSSAMARDVGSYMSLSIIILYSARNCRRLLRKRLRKRHGRNLQHRRPGKCAMFCPHKNLRPILRAPCSGTGCLLWIWTWHEVKDSERFGFGYRPSSLKRPLVLNAFKALRASTAPEAWLQAATSCIESRGIVSMVINS